MARAGNSSRFVSVNLSKSYGQPPSPSPGHASSVSSASGSSSSGYRARLQSGHSGMVVLSRPGRSQTSVSSTSSRTSKLAIPRPVNLPSLRREHAGNDPTVPLVGVSGAAGWSKQQVLAPPGDSLQSIPADSAAVGSSSMIPESSWSSPVSQAKAAPPLEGENIEQRTPFYQSAASSHQAPVARSSLYTPSGSRNSNAVSIQHAPLKEKAMVVRGEDFPTLQAAVRPLAVPALQRQRDMQQKQRDKQHELKDQHVKLQQLSKLQITKTDVLQVEHYAGPPLQPSRPQQGLPKQPSHAEGQSLHRVAEKGSSKFYGPSPLIRLTHTSNWGDDERETLQSANAQGSMQSDRFESGRPGNGYQFSDNWALNYKTATDTARPTSRNGSSSAYSRDNRDLRDHNRNGGFISEGRKTQDMGLSNGTIKGFSNQQFDVDFREDITSWSRGPARNDPLKQDWSFPPKEVSSNRDARFGNSSRSSNSRNMGLTRDMHTSAFRDVDLSYRGDNLGLDKFTRDVHSRDGSNRLDVNSSKHGVDDRQGERFRKSIGGHQYGRSDISSAGRVHAGARSDLSGLDYGREKRVSTLDPFTDEPRSSKSGQSLVFEAFVGFSGFEAKIAKRKKDELPNFRDHAREMFEAELERVQKMQEQERQRLAEERERAMELARKEEEERERLAREEELLRLKLEEEAREAAAQAQRDQEEAAIKAEEIRRAREEQKRMIVLEEERRKEAARRKLVELEQRIAMRASGRERNVGSLERARTEDIRLQDEQRGLQRFDRKEDDVLSRGALPVQTAARKELVDGPRSMPLENSVRRPFDSRGGEGFSGDRNRVVQMKRRETLDDGPGLHSTVKNYHHRDISLHELDHRSFSSRDLSIGPARSFPVGASQSSSIVPGQERVPAASPSRKEHWQSGYSERFPGGPLSADINTVYMDSEIERENDGWWGRDNHRKFQEGQRLNSPPLFSYNNGGENDYPSFSRLRHSLPKQPRVPPPIFGRASSHKPIIQSESMRAAFPIHNKNGSEDVSKDAVNNSSQEMTLEINPEKGDCDDASLERPVSAASSEMVEPPNHTTKVFDHTQGELKDVSQTCNDEISQPDEIDQLSEQLSDLTESEEQSREDEKQLTVDMQASEGVAYVDEDDGWAVQGRAEDMGKEMYVKEERIGEDVQDDLEDQEWVSSKIHNAKSTLDQGTEEEESTWESQHVEDEGDGVVDDPKGAADSQWERAQPVAPKIEKQDEKHDEREVETPAMREVVKDGPVESQNILSSANTLDYVQVGQSESHNRVQSFMQQFQQPFSFMAVPLPQSTTMNGVPLHPPMLPSMHNLQTQQDLPYHLQMGLVPSAPLMPNAIQIGSIQMPLQMHPQMPSVAHHHQQPPVFQFGQICQFSQPMPPMQPSFQMHHAIGQPLLAQHQQGDFFNYPVKESEEVPVGPSSGSSVSVHGPTDSLLGGSLMSKEPSYQNPGASLVNAAETFLPSVKIGQSPKDSSMPGADMDVEASQDTSVGKITGGRRRNSNARSYGIYGRGRGRSPFGKINGPYSVVETLPENSVKDAARIRTYRQDFRQSEYKIRKPVTFEKESALTLGQENHDIGYAKGKDASYGIASAEGSTVDEILDSSFYSQSFGGTNSQLTKGAPSVQSVQIGSKPTQSDVGQARVRSASSSSNYTELGDTVGDIALQGSVDFVFEQQGTEVQNDKDDFIEVRSKRQLLREQRELRDKAKIEELKVKEQIARKQQKVIGKSVLHEEASMVASGQHTAERLSVPNVDVVNNDGSRRKNPTSVIGSNLQQFCVTPSSIGLSTAAPNELKVSKSLQYQPVADATHTIPVKEHAFGDRYSNDSTATINAAWGVQKSSHEVVSLTQIQLEEAMRPFGYDGISPQMAPITERGSTVLEPGMSIPSGSFDQASAPVKASVSMPGPISSLLAGEKIQFGAVTSPTVISSSSHPPSPFVGAVGSQFGSDKANFSSHPLSHARNYFRHDSNDTFLSSNITTRVEDDMNGQLVDVEAEAMAAASAVAVAAISNDEAVNNYSDANAALGGVEPVGTFGSFSKSSGLDGTGAGIIQAPSKNLGVDNTITVALPADLSVETTAAPPQPSLPIHSVPPEIMLQHLPSRASPFPCLEMGTILGGQIFAYGPCEDAALSPFEPGIAGLGAGNVAGWQHRFSNTSDSFYGAPSPFMNPAGMQGHPHMLVYTNPFTQVGQFGQLGVSFMGTTYHPSGKQPDWTHTPYAASPVALSQSGGDVNAGRPPMLDVQQSAVASNSPQEISAAGCSMMPVPAPMSVFDPTFPSPFQAQWSRAPAPPFSNYHISGPAPGLNLQLGHGELGLPSQSIHASGSLQQVPETSSSHIASDAAAASACAIGVHFPEELGFGYSSISTNFVGNDVEVLLNRGHTTDRAEVSSGRLQSMNASPNLASVSSKNEPYLSSQDSRSNQLEGSHAQTSELDHQRVLGHHLNTSPQVEKRASQQAQGKGSLAVDWPGSNQRRVSSRTISTVSTGERGPASSPKSKQIYVAKPATPVRIMDAT